MNALEQVAQAARQRHLQFLLIGGFAVAEHGFPRLTADLDLLIPKDARPAWREFLPALGYTRIHQTEAFEQYAAVDPAAWPIDLMCVGQDTFAGMLAASRPATVQGVSIQLVSLEHLVALKLHVLKQGRLHRFLRDFEDVAQLLRIHRIDLSSPHWRDLIIRYGSPDLFEKLRRAAAAE